MSTRIRPGHVLALVLAYFASSLAHFVHNAEFIAFYPGLPSSITRETVYIAWCVIASIGLLAALLFSVGRRALAWAALALYGSFGLDGLLHYTLALCSENTLAANITIWAEAVTGLALLLVSAVFCCRNLPLRHSWAR